MNYDQFKTQIDRLNSVYGERYLGQERTKIIWKQVQDLTAFAFERFVNQIICESNTPPPIGRFTEWANVATRQEIQSRAKQKLEEIGKGQACQFCCDSGQILVSKKEDGSKWAFLCSYCDAAKMYGMGPIRDESRTISAYRTVWDKQKHSKIYDIELPKTSLLNYVSKR